MIPQRKNLWKDPLVLDGFCVVIWLTLLVYFVVSDIQALTVSNTLLLLFSGVLFVGSPIVLRRKLGKVVAKSPRGFCGRCGHELPPGERPEQCHECGASHQRFIIEYAKKPSKASTMGWCLLLMPVIYLSSFIPMSLFGPAGGPLGFLSAFGYDPNSFYSTQGLISSATADSNRNLGVWQELQKRTLTQEEREDLAASILARLDEGDDSFTRFGPAGRWLEGEITAGTLESATLIDAMDDEYNWNQSALQALLSRHLSDQDHATLLEVCIGALERGSWKARSEYRGWLENEFYAGTLSPAQIERLRACNWTPGLKMPRRVPADEPFEVVLTEGEPSGLHPHIFTEQYLAVAFGGVSIDGGPFLGPELPPALALFVRTSGALEKDAPYHRDFRMETSIAEPGVHTVAVKYYLFDGQHQRSLEPIDFDSDGEPIVPENSTWILERVVEREVVVSGEQFAADG